MTLIPRAVSSTGCIPEQLDYYWKDLLRTADADGDGRISKLEFANYIKSYESLTTDGHFADKDRQKDLCTQIKNLARISLVCRLPTLPSTPHLPPFSSGFATSLAMLARIVPSF